MTSFMGPMAPPPAAPPQPQALDFQTDPSNRQRFRQFLNNRMQPPMQKQPPMMQAPMMQPPMSQPPAHMPAILPEIDIFNPQGYADGGIVGGLSSLSDMSGDMVQQLNQVVYGGDPSGGGGMMGGGMGGGPLAPSGPISSPSPTSPPPNRDYAPSLIASNGMLGGNGPNGMFGLSQPAYAEANPLNAAGFPAGFGRNLVDNNATRNPFGISVNQPGNYANTKIDQGFYESDAFKNMQMPMTQTADVRAGDSTKYGFSGSSTAVGTLNDAYEQYLSGNQPSGQQNIFGFEDGGIVGFEKGGSTDLVERKHKDGRTGLYANNGSTFVGYKKEEDSPRFSLDKFKSAIGLEDGGSVPPRRTDIRGQDHMLSYITPDEADILQALGGSGEAGPMGIPAFYDEGDDYSGPGGDDSANDSDSTNQGGNDGRDDQNEEYDFEITAPPPSQVDSDIFDEAAGVPDDFDFGGNNDATQSVINNIVNNLNNPQQQAPVNLSQQLAETQLDPMGTSRSGSMLSTQEQNAADVQALSERMASPSGGIASVGGGPRGPTDGSYDSNDLLSLGNMLDTSVGNQPPGTDNTSLFNDAKFGGPATLPTAAGIVRDAQVNPAFRVGTDSMNDVNDFRFGGTGSPYFGSLPTSKPSQGPSIGIMPPSDGLKTDDVFTLPPTSGTELNNLVDIGDDVFTLPPTSGAAGLGVDVPATPTVVGNSDAETYDADIRLESEGILGALGFGPGKAYTGSVNNRFGTAVGPGRLSEITAAEMNALKNGSFDERQMYNQLASTGAKADGAFSNLRGFDQIEGNFFDKMAGSLSKPNTAIEVFRDPKTGKIEGLTHEGKSLGMSGGIGQMLGLDNIVYTGDPRFDPNRPPEGYGGKDGIQIPVPKVNPCPPGFSLVNGTCTPVSDAGSSGPVAGPADPAAPIAPLPVIVPSPRQPMPFLGTMPSGYGTPITGGVNPQVMSQMQKYAQLLSRPQPQYPVGLANGGPVPSNLDMAADNFLKALMPAA